MRKPVKVRDQHKTHNTYARFNTWLAIRITNAVGSMTCAYLFGCIALISLPAAISSGNVITIIGWVAQTFLQLVLLSVIIVGQNVQASAADKRSEQTYLDAESILAQIKLLEGKLDACISGNNRPQAESSPEQGAGQHPGFGRMAVSLGDDRPYPGSPAEIH